MNALLALMGAPADGATSGGSMVTTIVTFGLIILIFYFLIIRPQKKRDKEAKAMISAMKKGDKVVTIGGIHGTIIVVKDQTVVIKVDDNARIEFSKNAISSVTSRSNEKANPKKEEVKEVEEKVEAPKKGKVKKTAEVVDAEVKEEAPVAEDKE